MDKSCRLITLVALLALSQSVTAEGMGERFKSFILGQEANTAAKNLTAGDVDTESGKCLACHNGSRAKYTPMRAAGTPIQYRGFGTANHPVGTYYDQFAAMRPFEYRAASSLPTTIRFVEGRVGCLSCHMLKTDDPLRVASAGHGNLPANAACTASPELATGGKRDRSLCLSCHKK